MSREIKFRQPLYGNHIFTGKFNYWGFNPHGKGGFALPLRLRPSEQYIELTDKNKAEIWEGDIVTNRSGLRWTVVKDNEGARFALKQDSDPDTLCGIYVDWIEETELEVIGNIHANPELLEATQ